MNNSKLATIFIFIGILSAILIFLTSSFIFPYTFDSIIYITAAEQISKGEGLTYSNLFVQPAGPNYIPLKLYPPGYPILISTFNFFKIANLYEAALIIPRLCFILMPLAFFYIFREIMTRRFAVITSFLCAFIFPVFKCSMMAWTDIPFLFFSLISFVLIFQIPKKIKKKKPFYSFLSGLMVGYALLIRFVGYALFASIFLSLFLCFILKVLSLKDFLKNLSCYLFGFAIVFLPYCIRNWIIFGTMQPYKLPPSQISFTENLNNYLEGMSYTIFTNVYFDKIIILLLIFMIVYFLLKAKKLVKHKKESFIQISTIISYFILGSVLLLLSKTFYFGPESINERYLIQYTWIILSGLIYFIYYFLKKLHKKFKFDFNPIVGLIILSFLLIQIIPAIDFYVYERNVKKMVNKIDNYRNIIERVPKDYVIVSNVADITYYLFKRNVRMLNGYTPYGLLKLFEGEKKFAVLLIKENRPTSPSWTLPEMWINPLGYESKFSDDNIELLLLASTN